MPKSLLGHLWDISYRRRDCTNNCFRTMTILQQPPAEVVNASRIFCSGYWQQQRVVITVGLSFRPFSTGAVLSRNYITVE
jgi:hypothetical protein